MNLFFSSKKIDFDEISQRNEFGLPVAFLKQVVNLAQSELDVERIWIFGSRAKGVFRKHSDVDLAFEFVSGKDSEWARFCAELDETGLALVPFDLVDLGSCQPDLRAEILSTGKIIYEKNSSP